MGTWALFGRRWGATEGCREEVKKFLKEDILEPRLDNTVSQSIFAKDSIRVLERGTVTL